MPLIGHDRKNIIQSYQLLSSTKVCLLFYLSSHIVLGIENDTLDKNSQAEFAWLYKIMGSMLAVRIVYIPREL